MKLENKELAREQIKKLIYLLTLTDASMEISNERNRWALETSPEFSLHKLTFNMINSAYRLKLPSFYLPNANYRRTEFFGKKYLFILQDIQNSISQNSRYTIRFLFDEPLWFKIIAFRFAMDLEGSIITKFTIKQKSYKKTKYFQFQFEPEINFSIIDVNLANEWKKISSEIGLNLNVSNDERLVNKISSLRSSKKDDILQFQNLGGFLLGVKIHKSHEGIISNNGRSKQQVLNAVCHILATKNEYCSKYFKNKASAEKYRKFFVNSVYLPSLRLQKLNGPGRI